MGNVSSLAPPFPFVTSLWRRLKHKYDTSRSSSSGSPTHGATSHVQSIQVVPRTAVEPTKCIDLLYQIDPLDLKLFRNLSDGLANEITTHAVWATIPRANNGRSSKALMVDRHQRVLTKRENSKLYQELTNHVYLASRYYQHALRDESCVSAYASAPRIQEIQHPYILRLYGHFMQNRMLHLMVQYSQQGNLAHVLALDEKYEAAHHRRLRCFENENALKELIRQLCSAIVFIHECQLAHTNLRAENVFFSDDGNLAIGDFKDAISISNSGSSPAGEDQQLPMRNCFTAPERYGFGDDIMRSLIQVDLVKADAWSTGTLIFGIVTREHLFTEASYLDPDFVRFQELGFSHFYDMWKAAHTDRFQHSVLVSDDIKALLVDLIEANPLKRCTVAEAVGRHEWLQRPGRPFEMHSSQWKLSV